MAATLPSLSPIDIRSINQTLQKRMVSFNFPSSCTDHVQYCSSTKRGFPLAAMASSASSLQYLESAFGGREGITFSSIGDSCAVRLILDNGCSANLILPEGLVTSFKAPMWHGGTMELLHVSVSVSDDDGVFIRGGMSPAIRCENEAGEYSWSPDSNWVLHQIRGNSRDSIELQLVSSSAAGSDYGGVEVRNILILGQDFLTSEIVVSNSSSHLRVMGSIVCHLAVSTPDATYAIGLEGSDFLVRPPFLSNFNLIPPDFATTKGQDSGNFPALKKLFSSWGSKNQNDGDAEILAKEEEEEELQEEDDNYKHLSQKLSRIYHHAPRGITIMDRGKRNSVIVQRDGFEEVYVMSPGSSHEWYGKYSYVCIGHAAIVEPIILKAQTQWKGVMRLCNPNT